jgi:hypothetical protein
MQRVVVFVLSLCDVGGSDSFPVFADGAHLHGVDELVIGGVRKDLRAGLRIDVIRFVVPVVRMGPKGVVVVSFVLLEGSLHPLDLTVKEVLRGINHSY